MLAVFVQNDPNIKGWFKIPCWGIDMSRILLGTDICPYNG